MQTRSILVLMVVVSGAVVAQTTRNVPAQYPTIQAAIGACVNGDDVLVAPGTFSGPIDFLAKAINVHSSAGAAATTIVGLVGAAVVSFVTGEGALSILDGFTLTGGDTGVLVRNASPTVRNCSMVHNVSMLDGGAGVRCLTTGSSVASPSFIACAISQNVAAYPLGGGGLLFSHQSSSVSSPTMQDCVISSNFAGTGSSGPLDGGGILVTGTCSIVANNCAFVDNWAGLGGGCRLINATSGTFTRCRFSRNHGSYLGGGLSDQGTNLLLDGCLVSQNSSSGPAGALDVQLYGALTALIRGCTIAGNTSAFPSGGVWIPGASGAAVVDSVIWGNQGTDLDAVFTPVTNSDVGFGLFTAGAGVISSDPRFVDPANADYHLARSSPCRDAGSLGGGSTPFDLDGTARVVNGTVDMGADEIPLLSYPGTNEDLELYAWVNRIGDPLASSRACPAGSHLEFLFRSPGGSFAGANPVLAGVLFPSASPPAPIPGFPQVWLNGNVSILLGGLNAPPLSMPGLPAAGIALEFLVPPGLSGHTARFQALVTTPFAANGAFAITNATEAVF